MITDTIDRVQSAKELPRHPYIRVFKGYFKRWNIVKRLILKILG
jgi:hypothetical protein